jgi:hypothetical protein
MQRTGLELISKEAMATPLTDFTFPDSQWERHGKYPTVTNICQIYKPWEHSFIV